MMSEITYFESERYGKDSFWNVTSCANILCDKSPKYYEYYLLTRVDNSGEHTLRDTSFYLCEVCYENFSQTAYVVEVTNG